MNPPAKPVGHDPDTEGSHHATHAEDGHGDAPDDGANSWADWLPVALHPGVVEERAQFLTPRMEKQYKLKCIYWRINVISVQLYTISLASGPCSTLTDLLGCIDDSGVVAKLQRADDGGAQREEQVAGDLLLLLRDNTEPRRQCGNGISTRREESEPPVGQGGVHQRSH